MTKSDKEWQAESDFYALRSAAEVMGNKARMKAAVAYGKKEQEKLDKSMKSLRKLTNG
ncbi:MAG: hypothetical protein GTN99_08040 [Candidatus Dadabacteria bacterium]|nr:hypothetical protein [Candidatus Dadabacteria bacterium]